MSEEDMEQVPRRRSARIIALEEKKEREKKALEEARKNKGKAVIVEEDHDLIDIDDDDDEDDDDYAPIKKRGRKSRPLNQLISLTQPIREGQYCAEYSRRYGLPRVPPKDTLELVLDLLQRKDPDEFFAQPVNPADQDYHNIVKEPMDFGTMRAKLHENMYANMDQFKRDVYLLCSNAVNVNPSSASPHKVAEAINNEASKLFHGLPADQSRRFCRGQFGLDEKKSRGRKTYVRSKNSGRRRQLPSEPGVGNSGANNNSMEAEVEKRQTYYPSSGDSIFSGFLDGPKSCLLFHKPSCYYQESLARFVEVMAPTVQKCAARKIESLRYNQIRRGEATRPNPLADFLDPTEHSLGPASTVPPPPLPRPPTAATRLGHDAPHSRHSPILSNRPLTVPGFTPQAPQESRNINVDRNGDYKGKKVAGDSIQNWDTYAAAILSGYFMNNGGRGGGLNLNGGGSSSTSTMAPSFQQNTSSFLTMSPSSHEANQNQNQWMQRINDCPESSNARSNFVNTPGNSGSDVASGEFTQFPPRVWPSIVISGPQAQSRPNSEPINTSDRPGPPKPAVMRPLSGQSLLSCQNLARHEQEPTLGHNLSEHSLLPQSLTEFDFTLLKQALWSQQIPAEQGTANNFTWQSFMPQNKPALLLNENNLSWQSFMPQQIPQEAMNMNSYNSSGQSLFSQQSRLNSNPMNGYTLSGGKSFMSQQRPEDLGLATGWQYFLPQSDSMTCQYFMPQQKPQDSQAQAALTGYYDNLSHVANLTGEGTSNLGNLGNRYQPEDFQTIWAPIDLNSIPFKDPTSIYTAPPAFLDNSAGLLMHPEPGPEPDQLNPLGPFPGRKPRLLSSSASLEMPMGVNAMNYYVGNAMVGQPAAAAGEGTSTARLQWHDDRQPNLALQL